MRQQPGILIECDEPLILSFVNLNDRYNFIITVLDKTRIFVKQYFDLDGVMQDTVKYLNHKAQAIINENSSTHDAYE